MTSWYTTVNGFNRLLLFLDPVMVSISLAGQYDNLLPPVRDYEFGYWIFLNKVPFYMHQQVYLFW